MQIRDINYHKSHEAFVGEKKIVEGKEVGT